MANRPKPALGLANRFHEKQTDDKTNTNNEQLFCTVTLLITRRINRIKLYVMTDYTKHEK